MIRTLAFIVGTILLVLLQTSFVNYMPLLQRFVNLLVIGTVYATLYVGGRRGVWFAVTAGVIMDTLSPYLFGTYALSLLIVTMVTELVFGRYFSRRSVLAILSLTFLGTLCFMAGVFGVSAAASYFGVREIAVPLTPGFVAIVFGQGVVNALLVLLVVAFRRFGLPRLMSRFFITRRTV